MKKLLYILTGAVLLAAAGCGENERATKLPVPTGVLLEASTATTLTFTWDAVPGAVSYTCRMTDASGATVPSPVTREPSVTVNNLTEGTLYRFSVKAKAADEALDSDWSSPVEGTPTAVPDPPKPPVTLGPVVLPAWEDDDLARAFPGAEGGGMFTTGGRGGEVIHVTNLNDSGEGSLRAAINRTGARTIVFDVSGVIQLKSRLAIRNGDLTIAGQTAPGDGICLRDNSVYVGADNVIIRYMRFRMGDATNVEDDAIWGRYQKNIILDHCSMSWCTDECASFYANCNFTMQWCLITESLRASVHGKGSHGYGGIWGGRNASFHHNMLANHDSRNARLDHPQVYATYIDTHRGNVDFRNNVIYNWGSNTTYGGEDGRFNMVNNYYKQGPASSPRGYFLDAYNNSNSTQWNYPRVYMAGNHYQPRGSATPPAMNDDNRSGGIYAHQGTGHGWSEVYLDAPLSIKADDTKTTHVSNHTAAMAYERVLDHAGANLSRDAVDGRAVGDARSGTATFPDGGNGSKNGIIDTQTAVGGWPTYNSTTPPADTDGDGMPDEWERLTNLDPNNAADAKTTTMDPRGRYTNLELYLHYLVQDTVLAQAEGHEYTALD